MAVINRKWRKRKGRRYLLNNDANFQLAESYKTLRTNLMYALAASEGKNIIVSSPGPNEGKSSLCANLAVTMAQASKKILLIDADLRKPVQHTIFEIPNRIGLSSLLGNIEEAKLSDAVRKVKVNLDVITSGPIPPNPSELLGSSRMDALLNLMEKHYDYIFIDTSPINIVTDPLVLASKSVGVLLASYYGETTYDSLAKAVSSMEHSGAKVLGLVINGSKESAKKYYEGGYYAYK